MKKPRRIIITLEIETDAPLKYLKDWALWQSGPDGEGIYDVFVRQVQANVIREGREGKEKG